MQDDDWLKNGLSEDHLKATVEGKNWSGVTIGSNNTAYYKSVNYRLTPELLRHNQGAKGIWLCEYPSLSELAEPAG